MHATPRRAARGAAAFLALVTTLGVTACTSSGTPGTDATPAPTMKPADRATTLAAALADEELVGQVLMPSVGLSAPWSSLPS